MAKRSFLYASPSDLYRYYDNLNFNKKKVTEGLICRKNKSDLQWVCPNKQNIDCPCRNTKIDTDNIARDYLSIYDKVYEDKEVDGKPEKMLVNILETVVVLVKPGFNQYYRTSPNCSVLVKQPSFCYSGEIGGEHKSHDLPPF